MNVSVKMTAVEAIRRIDDDIFWSIDEFINTRPFRLTRTNFPLYYYNRRYVLLFTNIDKRYLDHIYTDADMLLATWDSRNFSPQGCKLLETSSRLPNCCACDVVVVLCGLLQETVMSRLEEHLVSTVITNWITLQVLLLPCRREDRFEELCQLIAEYDRLSFLLGVECEAKLRDNVIETVQMVTGTAAENTATIGIETTATTLGHAAAGVVLAVFVDVAVTASMLVRAKVRKDRGKITERQYKREIRERLFQTGCQFVGGTTGTIVGQIVVPIPVVGAAIGGFVGSLVGLVVSLGVGKIQKVVEKARRRKEMPMLEKP